MNKTLYFNFVIHFFKADDIFGIDELTLYEGEWKDSNYAVAGEVLDGVSSLVKHVENITLVRHISFIESDILLFSNKQALNKGVKVSVYSP